MVIRCILEFPVNFLVLSTSSNGEEKTVVMPSTTISTWESFDEKCDNDKYEASYFIPGMGGGKRKSVFAMYYHPSFTNSSLLTKIAIISNDHFSIREGLLR